MSRVTQQALNLSERERAELAHTLLRSLEPAEEQAEMEAAREAEIAQRVKRIKKGTAKGKPAHEVLREVRGRYV